MILSDDVLFSFLKKRLYVVSHMNANWFFSKIDRKRNSESNCFSRLLRKNEMFDKKSRKLKKMEEGGI